MVFYIINTYATRKTCLLCFSAAIVSTWKVFNSYPKLRFDTHFSIWSRDSYVTTKLLASVTKVGSGTSITVPDLEDINVHVFLISSNPEHLGDVAMSIVSCHYLLGWRGSSSFLTIIAVSFVTTHILHLPVSQYAVNLKDQGSRES